jgi:KaiC/GvpD/RAD55 family RecA-like ATPase
MNATSVVVYTTVGGIVNDYWRWKISIPQNAKLAFFFDVMGMNELLARPRPQLRQLFGDMWLSGELSVMFAEAGCGKSVLAVQIAESIARGKEFAPMEIKPQRQKVVYIDLETSPEQFCSRYSHDDSGRYKPYRFSRNFIYAGRRENAEPPIEMIGKLIDSTGAKVLVIDNLTHLMRGHSSSETMRVTRELRRICRRDGVSILLLVHSPPANLRRGIETRDMPFADVISAVADNVFAVGRVGSDSTGRYIKHLRPGPSAYIFGASHVPWFRVRKRANFTFFDFCGFAREGALRLTDNDRREWDLIGRIGELRQAGMTMRGIGKALEMSKTTVQKYAVIAGHERPLESINRDEATADGCYHVEDQDPVNEFDVSGWPWGEEVGFEDSDDLTDDLSAVEEDLIREVPPETPEPDPTVDIEPRSEYPLLEKDVDPNGREIWVEKRDERGHRLIWYLAQTNCSVPTGKYTRYEHRGLAGNIGSTVDCLPANGSGRAPPGKGGRII